MIFISSLTQLTGLTELGIDNSPAHDSRSPGVPVAQLVTSLTALRCLNLQLPSGISLALASGLAGLSNLTRLQLRALDDREKPAVELPTLSGLVHLQGLKQLTYEAPAVQLAAVLPRLTTLEGLDFCATYSSETPEPSDLITESALAPLQQLTRLSWDCSGKFETLARSLRQLSSLRQLKLRGNLGDDVPTNTNPALCSTLGSLSQLTRLCLEGFDFALDVIAVTSMLRVLSSVTWLQQLELRHCGFVDAHVAAIAQNLTALTNLKLVSHGLGYEEEISLSALETLIMLTKLEELHLGNISGVEELLQKGFFHCKVYRIQYS